MTLNIAREVAAMGRMTATELRAKHAEVFGEPTKSGNKEYLVKRIVWRMQANAEGVLSERARLRAEELANDAALRTTAPKMRPTRAAAETVKKAITFDHDARLPMPGAILRRQYKDRELVVRVLPNGFECDGTIYRTLSAVAKAVTGAHWNGYHFFGLERNARCA
jgi:hypothetical protein